MFLELPISTILKVQCWHSWYLICSDLWYECCAICHVAFPIYGSWWVFVLRGHSELRLWEYKYSFNHFYQHWNTTDASRPTSSHKNANHWLFSNGSNWTNVACVHFYNKVSTCTELFHNTQNLVETSKTVYWHLWYYVTNGQTLFLSEYLLT